MALRRRSPALKSARSASDISPSESRPGGPAPPAPADLTTRLAGSDRLSARHRDTAMSILRPPLLLRPPVVLHAAAGVERTSASQASGR